MGDYASNQKAQKVSRFKTCKAGKYQCWITGAALALIEKHWLCWVQTESGFFKIGKDDDFFSGDVSEIDLGLITQKEAITFMNDSLVVIADENFLGIGGNLYILIRLNK